MTKKMKFNRGLYPKIALIKAAYNYIDKFYVHLDADNEYYYVDLESKNEDEFNEQEFVNEMLTQSIRHEVYLQTKDIRTLLLARALATSVITDGIDDINTSYEEDEFDENEILKDWFMTND